MPDLQPEALTAFLACAEHHILQAPHGSDEEARESLISAGCYYAPRLLAAVKKVLGLHKPEAGGLHGHPGLRVCGRCSTASSAQVWPCYEYEVISRELLGEGETDA